MEILQFIISFFIKEYGGENFLPIFNLLKDNGFDLKKSLKCAKPELFAPILQSFISKSAKTNPTHEDCVGYKLNPINNIADKKIVLALNRYFTN